MAIYNVTTYQKTEINRDLTCSITSRSDWCFDLVKERSNLGFIHKKKIQKWKSMGLLFLAAVLEASPVDKCTSNHIANFKMTLKSMSAKAKGGGGLMVGGEDSAVVVAKE